MSGWSVVVWGRPPLGRAVEGMLQGSQSFVRRRVQQEQVKRACLRYNIHEILFKGCQLEGDEITLQETNTLGDPAQRKTPISLPSQDIPAICPRDCPTAADLQDVGLYEIIPCYAIVHYLI